MQESDKSNILQVQDSINADLTPKAIHSNQIVIDFRKRCFRVTLLLITTLVLIQIKPEFIGLSKQSHLSMFIIFILSTIIYLYGGWPFLKGFFIEVSKKKPGSMFTIGIMITIAYIFSIAIIFDLQKIDFFRELIALILIMILDYWIEIKSIAKSSKELELL
jgi:Cu2+-exporting ATPase